jgi:KDO2-lipid IV(A) lauroyltransferase
MPSGAAARLAGLAAVADLPPAHAREHAARAGRKPKPAAAFGGHREAGKGRWNCRKVWLRPLAETAARVVEISGWELVEAAARRGRGILYLTPHLGCFEITAQYLSTHAPITVLYRPPKQAWLQTMIEAGRARAQLHLAAADLSGVRSLLKALKRGEAVGMLPDQAPKAGEGRWLDFFGKPAYTMTLAARLVESGASVIMVWAERLPAGGAAIIFTCRRRRDRSVARSKNGRNRSITRSNT